MIYNPMYKTADYSKRYCISRVSFGGMTKNTKMIFDGSAIDVMLSKDDCAESLPPFDDLTCLRFTIEGVIPAREDYGEIIGVWFGVVPDENEDYLFELKFKSSTRDRFVYTATGFHRDDDTFSISVEEDVIHVHVAPPFEEAVRNILIDDGLMLTLVPSSQDPSSMTTESRCIMLDVQCSKAR